MRAASVVPSFRGIVGGSMIRTARGKVVTIKRASSLESDELQAERAQPAPRLGVIGLRVGARFAQHIEVEPALAVEGGRDRELKDRRGAVLDRADRRGARLTDHGRVSVGGGGERLGG